MKQLPLFRGIDYHLVELDASEIERRVADHIASALRRRHPFAVCTGVRRADGRKVWRITEAPGGYGHG